MATNKEINDLAKEVHFALESQRIALELKQDGINAALRAAMEVQNYRCLDEMALKYQNGFISQTEVAPSWLDLRFPWEKAPSLWRPLARRKWNNCQKSIKRLEHDLGIFQHFNRIGTKRFSKIDAVVLSIYGCIIGCLLFVSSIYLVLH